LADSQVKAAQAHALESIQKAHADALKVRREALDMMDTARRWAGVKGRER